MSDEFYGFDDSDFDEEIDERETCILCGCIIGEEVGVGLRNPDGSGRCWCDLCYGPSTSNELER